MKLKRLLSQFNLNQPPIRLVFKLFTVIILLVGLIAATYLVRQKTGLFTKAAPNQARFYFEPSSYSVSPQSEFWTKLWLDTCTGSSGCTGVSAASVILRYDPALLQVIDAQGNPAQSVTLGDYFSGETIFPGLAENVVDHTRGEIRVSSFAADISSSQKIQPFSGNKVFISIRFKMLGTTNTQITFDYTPYTGTGTNLTDGSSVYWAQSASEDILNLGTSPNPVAFTVSIASSNVPGLSLVPVGTPLTRVGDSFDARILVNSLQTKTVATDVVLTYPPNLLQVVDSDTSVPGVQITPGTIYQAYEYANTQGVDTANGIIDLSGYTLTGTDPLANGIFATVRFRVLAQGSANLNFKFTAGQTNESNILEYQPGVNISQAKDILTAVQNLTLSLGSTATPTPTPVSKTPTPTPRPTSTPTPKPTSTPTGTPVPCNDPWDFDHNCCVNGADVSIMIARWGAITQESNRFVDLDSNSKVNGADIAILVAHWGGACR